MNSVSTFPFYTLEGWNMDFPLSSDLPLKGDTIIGNDLWIGQNAIILPGTHIGDGAIIGANSVAGSNVSPYSIVIGNPARVLRKRFDYELIDLMLKIQMVVHLICKAYNKVKILPTINRKTTFLFNFQGSNPFTYGIY